MYTLAVDPGVHTGVALLNPEGDIVWTLTCESPYAEVKSAVEEYVRPEGIAGHNPNRCDLAAEASPNTRHYQDVHSQVSDLFAGLTVHWIRPSEWKNHPFCQVSGLGSKHEAEAVGIGRAHILRRKRDETRSADTAPNREHQKSS